jgi:hypothetical protein
MRADAREQRADIATRSLPLMPCPAPTALMLMPASLIRIHERRR